MTDRVTLALKLNIYGQPLGTPFDVFTRLARHAESAGFEAAYVVDHLYLPAERYAGYTWADPQKPYFLDAWTVLAALGQATHRIRLGTQVSPLTFRHPSHLAKMGATVDLISNGRLVMQLGTGWHKDEHKAYGFPFEEGFAPRFAALREGIEIIRGLWTAQEPFTYEGRHFQVRDAPFWPKPVQQPSPPIWLGGGGKKVRGLIGELGDGWSPAMSLAEGVGPRAYAEAITEIRSVAAEHGRDPSKITAALLCTTAVHEDRDKAAELASVLHRREDYASMSLEEMRDRGILIWGTPDDCRRALEGYIAVGVRHFTLNFVPFADADAAVRGMDLYASKVLPRLG